MTEQKDNRIVLIGGGGHCKVVIDSLLGSNKKLDLVITDNSKELGTKIMGIEVAGTDEELASLFSNGFKKAFIAIGSIKTTFVRRKIFDYSKNIGFDFIKVIDKTSAVAKSASIGKGVYIGKQSSINAEACIDDFAIINSSVSIEHDCHVGKFTHISVGATICGGCDIGNDSFVGANATIIQGRKIGNNSIIGAGSLILADVPDNREVFGTWKG